MTKKMVGKIWEYKADLLNGFKINVEIGSTDIDDGSFEPFGENWTDEDNLLKLLDNLRVIIDTFGLIPIGSWVSDLDSNLYKVYEYDFDLSSSKDIKISLSY